MTAGSWKGNFFFNIDFFKVTNENFIGSVKENANPNLNKEDIIGKDIIQDKYTIYGQGIEIQ